MVEALGGVPVAEANGVMAVRRAMDEPFDLILMDIAMPVMDGIEAARTIRRGSGPNKNVAIVAVTAHAVPGETDDLVAQGFDAVVHKPLTGEKLAKIYGRFTEPDMRKLTGS
jgi:CheY-like chemotaxis protein